MHGNTLWHKKSVRWPRADGFGQDASESVYRSAAYHLDVLHLPNRPQMNLAEHHVPGSKDTYYIPDFVTEDEETYLLRKVSLQSPTFLLNACKLAHCLQIQETPQPKWKQLSNRRCVTFVLNDLFCANKQNRLQTWGDSQVPFT
jgi:hypothetical protein